MDSKILIVDDENEIRHMLRTFFELNGYRVVEASSGYSALRQINDSIDLILLDINMPDIDGLTLCKKIRHIVGCPILFLTARVQEEDKIYGLNIGADDYMIKPFSLEELGARVAAHLRREKRQKVNTKVYLQGELVIDYCQRSISIKNQKLSFTKKEFDIIEVLSQNNKQIFDKERLYECVWGLDSMGDNTVVAEHIRRIRAKFAEVSSCTYIETVWGVGYKWNG